MPAENKDMTPQVAITNLSNVAQAYKGTKAEHDILQQSLECLSSTLNENLKELESMSSELDAANVQIRTLQAELAATSPEPEEEPAAPRTPVKLEGTPRIGRPAQRAGA